MTDRPEMRMSGPCVDAPDVAELVHFYADLLGWEIDELYGARPGKPPGDGWGRVRPPDKAPGQKIEVQWEEHYQRPVWPGEPDKPGMQMHLDVWVEDLERGVAWAIECGAKQAEPQPSGRDPSRLRVMLDPAGHPFCLWS